MEWITLAAIFFILTRSDPRVLLIIFHSRIHHMPYVINYVGFYHQDLPISSLSLSLLSLSLSFSFSPALSSYLSFYHPPFHFRRLPMQLLSTYFCSGSKISSPRDDLSFSDCNQIGRLSPGGKPIRVPESTPGFSQRFLIRVNEKCQ